jgi:hypothetical protein
VTFDPQAYGSAVGAIFGDGQRLMPLGPGTPDESKRKQLAAFDPIRDLPNVKNADTARACHAGLWLYWDFLDESHSISQELHTPEGSAWHAIMHRREPDASNSKYWWKRVGPHPFIAEMKNMANLYFSPSAFVDFCESVRGKVNAEEEFAKQVQLVEWRILFDDCFQRAVGFNPTV